MSPSAPPSFDEHPAELNARDARAFLADARRATDLDHRRRLIAAAVYFAVAVYESARERAENDAAKKLIKAAAEKLLPHYRLLHDVRIHNFHRRPLPAADPRLLFAWVGPSVSKPGAPMSSLLASAQTVGGSGRPVSMTREGAALKLHDRDQDVWITDEEAIGKYLDGVAAFLQEIRSLID